MLYPDVKNQLITVNLADTSVDGRSLLGSYVRSTRSSGTFEWKEGVLARAMRTGRWVILQDVDKGSNEVLGTLKPLVESVGMGKWIGGRAKLAIPSRGELVASESFAIFATRSLSMSGDNRFPLPTFFGAHKFHEVIIPIPTQDELRVIIASSFPKLSGPAACGIILLPRLAEVLLTLGIPSSRIVSPLDTVTSIPQVDCVSLLVSVFPNPTLREEMFLEARDVFFGAGSLTSASRTRSSIIAATMAEHLGLTQEKCDWLLSQHTPEVVKEVDSNGRVTRLRLGRVGLSARTTKSDIIRLPTRPFVIHRPAATLMTRMATCISLGEPVLLTGETGTGKTSVITHLASLLHHPLISINFSQQTESSDLLGSFKPIDARVPGFELQLQFLDLFRNTFSQKKNVKFEESTWKAVKEGKWKRAVGLWKESVRLAKDRIRSKLSEVTSRGDSHQVLDSEAPRKRRRTEEAHFQESEKSWSAFEQEVLRFEAQYITKKGKFAFGFVEGPLVRALRSGDWILLDEINLASTETLEAVSTLLRDPTSSITLTEQGSMEPVPRHPDFRIFACMNPATDAGKKELPPGIRSYFTEIEVPPPDADRETLLAVITQYIGPSAVSDKAAIMDVAEFYTTVKALIANRRIADGSNRRPHFSMRTLARALTFAAEIASSFSLRRALWEGCLMAFTMALDAPSMEIVTTLAQKHILNGIRNVRLLLTREPAPPQSRPIEDFIKLGPFYLEKGDMPELPTDEYVLTPSVERKLIDLARIISTRMFPVLIEGPTSSGKTSTVEFLAKRTGHRFVRINNHEHTDIQEYLGTYISDPVSGKLVFKDGLLVQALRRGDWIVLDELNLAPTDVLEALNRLLDDNRELFVPETQEVIKPHPHFMLFATQNPPGLYAGRKVPSRAFRGRFLDVHFADVPQGELETILCQRCRIAPSYAQRIVAVFRELQKRRQTGRVFESKQGFATLRDLFRWAGRDAVGYQELAQNGYMLLAERARREDDRVVVKSVIESIMKVHIDETTLYNFDRFGDELKGFLGFDIPSSNIVWTTAMQRLLILVGRALRFKEPVLLVGETGSGKTSVCQVYADAVMKRLLSLNCHQNTETADLIGGLRPIRNKAAAEAEIFSEATSLLSQHGITGVFNDAASLLSAIDQLQSSRLVDSSKVQEVKQRLRRTTGIFEWHDGPLVEAMKTGDVFLLDEISLADDSVLERLNSVLEPARTVVLAEKGGDNAESSLVDAALGFRLIATMNPGGDYGKKELSPALRNRFTEIWVPPVDARADLTQIISSSWRHESLKPYTPLVLDFIKWFSRRVSEPSLFGLRDIIAWVTFSNSILDNPSMEAMSHSEIFHHAAHMVCLDGLGSLPALSGYSIVALRKLKDDAVQKLREMVLISQEGSSFDTSSCDIDCFVQLGPFSIPKGPLEPVPHTYDIQAPTTRDNAMRVVRASQLSKPILLEGSPGVGKTSLITILANICGYHLCRINLSDQTDLSDLFGADLPVDGGRLGEFLWKEADFLKAMQEGHWVLLDEMNLAPQSVLEGLNAVLDHRGAVYVPELGRTFSRHPSFRIFAAQNPIQQGGGRKGLPKSFINRFTKVFVDPLTPADLLQISKRMFPRCPEDWLQRMIVYNSRLEEETSVKHSFGRSGSPWEFNLRDICRWGLLLHEADTLLHPVQQLRTAYLSRFRTVLDKESARALFDSVFNISSNFLSDAPHPSISPSNTRIGHFVEDRKSSFKSSSRPGVVLQAHLPSIEAMGLGLQQGWLVIISGPPNSGKTSLVRAMAELGGNPLQEISVNHATDTTDILGSYEQVDSNFRALALVRRVLLLSESVWRTSGGSKSHALLNHGRLRTGIIDPPPIEILPDLLKTALDTLECLVDLGVHGVREKIDLQEGLWAELASPKTAGQFEWIDGPLVIALKEGHWLLLDNANLCGPSVLDRLNSLCEPSGVLTLNERGTVDGTTPVIVPHPNFRLIMCTDPQHGELSRAMRNRGIEISLSPPRNDEDLCRLQDFHFLPSTQYSSDADYVSTLDFEMMRRCLQDTSSPANSTAWPPAIIGDLSISAVVDRASLILPRDISTLQPPSLAVLNFFVRSMIPAYASHYSRFISGLYSPDRSGPLCNVHLVLDVASRDSIWPMLGQIRQLIWPASSIFGPTQSMDFFMKSTTAALPSTESVHPTAQSTILRIYELFVRTTYHHFEEPSSLHFNARDDSRTDNPSHAVLTRVDEFTKITSQHGANLLREAPKGFTRDLSAEIQLIIDLLKYTTFLRNQPNSAVNFSVLQTVASWIQEALQLAPVHLPNVSRSAELLSRAVAPTSGFGLKYIWLSWMSSISPRSYIPELEQVIACADVSGDGYKTRSQHLEHITTKYLKTMTNPSPNSNPGDIPASTGLEQWISCRATSKIEVPRTDRISVIKELGILTHIPDGNSLTICDQIIDLACSDHRMSLQRFITYRHATWVTQSGKSGEAGITLSAIGSWLQALWDHGDPSGPSILFQPTELATTIQTCDLHGVTLQSVSAYEKALEHHSRLLTITGTRDSTRIEDITILLRKTLLLLASCFHESFDESTLEDLQGAYRGPPSLADLQHSLVGRDESRPTTIRNLGLSWISLSRFFMDLYIPDTVSDPAALHNSRSEFWAAELDSLSHEFELEVNLERRVSGNTTNGVINYINEQIKHARERLHHLPHVPRTAGRDLFRLREFWSEISQFLLKVIPESRLNRLIDAFHANSPEALASEHVIQESIARFFNRLEGVYPEFDDISRPLWSALLYLRLGLRLVAHASACEEAAFIEGLSRSLVAFPSVGGASSLITADIRGDFRAIERTPFESILVVLTAIAFEVELGIDKQFHIAAMENVYERAVRLWLIDQKKQEEADVASQSLYRTNRIAHDAKNESEMEEDFLAIFPDYEAHFDPDHSKGAAPVIRPNKPCNQMDLTQAA
ncbi:P-loop containing nucleoside triphosphate hydrolase protein [Russula dissimulans]|nr:P-loop containing nucleoside triphosphate hydrolase protein [Russula dissimulans]